MKLYPAIDILDGRAVRLVQGDFDSQTVYGEDPLEAARTWVEAGVTVLHVVDLDGARTGQPQNLEHLHRIATELDVPVQFGGGLRQLAAVRQALRAGADGLILGTAAYSDVEFLDEVLDFWGDRTLVSVDARGGMLSTSGWTETTEIPVEAAIELLQDRGARSFVFTDVDRDGMLGGPDLDRVRMVADAATAGDVVYSGGIGKLEDLEALAGLGHSRLGGVIVGKALYEQRFTIAEAQTALGDGA